MLTRTNRLALLAVVTVTTLTMATSVFADGRGHRSDRGHDRGQATHRQLYYGPGNCGVPARSFRYGNNHTYVYYDRVNRGVDRYNRRLDRSRRSYRHGSYGHGSYGRGSYGHGSYGHGSYGRGSGFYFRGSIGHGTRYLRGSDGACAPRHGRQHERRRGHRGRRH